MKRCISLIVCLMFVLTSCTVVYAEQSVLYEQVLIDTLHSVQNGISKVISYDGDEVHYQNGATLTIAPHTGNNGNGFVYAYGGEKLTYHGKDDNARKENSEVDFIFSPGDNSVYDSLSVLKFNLSTNAPGRTYVSIYNGTSPVCVVANAKTEFKVNQKHEISYEIDRRKESLNEGAEAVISVYLDKERLCSFSATEVSSSMIVRLGAYKTPAITITDVKYSIFSGSVSMHDEYSSYMKTLKERSSAVEKFDSVNDISTKTSVFDERMKKDLGGSWEITESPETDYNEDRCIRFDSVGNSDSRIAFHNLWNASVSAYRFDIYFEKPETSFEINIKTENGWTDDHMMLSDGVLSGVGNGTKYSLPVNSHTWYEIGVLFDGESGDLWFECNGVPLYHRSFDETHKYMAYFEITDCDGMYNIDNVRYINFNKKSDLLSDCPQAVFYESDGNISASVSLPSEISGNDLTIYGALYDMIDNTCQLKKIVKKDIVFQNVQSENTVDIEIGEKEGASFAKLMYFGGETGMKPMYRAYSRSIFDIESDVKLYLDFENEPEGSAISGGVVVSENGNKVLKSELSKNETSLRFDAFCLGDFVISFDVSASDTVNGEFVVYGGGTPAYLIRFDSDGYIKNYNGEKLAPYTDNMKKITIVFNHQDKCFDIYADGEKVCNGLAPGVTFDKCVYFEFLMTSPSDNSDIYLDNIVVYPAYVYTDKCFYYDRYSEPISTEKEIILSSNTTIPSDTAQKNILSDKISVHIRSGVVYDGKRKHILSELPYVEKDEFMLPSEFYEDVMGLKVTSDGDNIMIGSDIIMRTDCESMYAYGNEINCECAPVVKDEVLFLPLRTIVGKALGKYVEYDNTTIHSGMIVISDNKFTLPSGDELQLLNDFCFYYRPDKEMFYKNFKASGMGDVHPRIMATNDDFEKIKSEIQTNSVKAGWYSNLISYCDRLEDEPALFYELRDGVRLMYAADDFENRMIALGAAYMLSGNIKYFDIAWKDIESVSKMPDWNPSHHIDVGIMALGYAVAYDWFYDAMTPYQRSVMEKTAYNNCLWTVNEAIESENTPYGWVMMENNHNVFVNAGNMAVCLAFMDVYPDECSKIGSDIVRILEAFLDKFAPSGQYYEGPHYATIAIDYTTRLFSVMEKTVGLFGLDLAEGFSLIGDYLTYMQSDVSNFNFADSDPGFVSSTGLFWLYDHYGIKGAKDTIANNFYASATRDEAAQALLWYDITEEENERSLKLDVHYDKEEIITMRNSFDKGQVFVGIKAGDTVYDHSHYDVGSFVYDAYGVRWAHDLGKDDYNLYYKYPSDDIFRIRAESHNVLLINPDSSPGFEPGTRACVTEFESTDDSAKVVIDMTQVYGDRVMSAKRGFLFTDNRRSLVVRDEVVTENFGELNWLMYIDSYAEIVDSNTVILTDKCDPSLKVRVEFCSNIPGVVGVEEAKPFPDSAQIEQQNPNDRFYRLIYKVNGSGEINITVKITPSGCESTDIRQYDTYIDKWTIH